MCPNRSTPSSAPTRRIPDTHGTTTTLRSSVSEPNLNKNIHFDSSATVENSCTGDSVSKPPSNEDLASQLNKEKMEQVTSVYVSGMYQIQGPNFNHLCWLRHITSPSSQALHNNSLLASKLEIYRNTFNSSYSPNPERANILSSRHNSRNISTKVEVIAQKKYVSF